MTLAFEVERYPRYDRENHYRLFTEAWAEHFATGGQARLPAATLANLYENNPAGAAFLAVARDGKKWAGTLAAIPFRVRIAPDETITAYQLSDAVVSPAYRRRSVLTRLVELLTRELNALPRTVTFTFPNRRSRTAFTRNGFRRIRTLPTRFYFPSPAGMAFHLDAEKKIYRKFNRPVARCREVGHAEAAGLTAGRDTILPRLVRDRGYLEWRYFQPPGEERFRLLAIERVKTGETQVAALACHRYRRGKYTIFLELLPQAEEDNPRWLSGLLLTMGRRGGCGLLYANERIGGGLLGPAWGAPLPERFNPRPVEMLIHPRPGNEELEKQFLKVKFTTADWLGFL